MYDYAAMYIVAKSQVLSSHPISMMPVVQADIYM